MPGRFRKDHEQGDAQHAGFLRAEELGEIVIGELLLSGPECPECGGNHEGGNQQHRTQGFHTHIGGKAGIKNDAGKTKIHDELLKTADALGGDEGFLPGQHTQIHGCKDRYNYPGNGNNFIHYPYLL